MTATGKKKKNNSQQQTGRTYSWNCWRAGRLHSVAISSIEITLLALAGGKSGDRRQQRFNIRKSRMEYLLHHIFSISIAKITPACLNI